MDLREYRELARKTDLGHPVDYYYLGLADEVGEVLGVRKRVLRGDAEVGDLALELGDVHWYLDRIEELEGLGPEEALARNWQKLNARLKAGTIRGKGDYR